MTNAVTWRESALRGTLVWFCPWSNAPSRSATIPRQSSTPLKTQADPCKLPRFLTLLEELKLSMLMLRPKQGRHVRT